MLDLGAFFVYGTLASNCGLRDVQIGGLDQTQVGRNTVSRSDCDKIPHYQFLSMEFHPLPVSLDGNLPVNESIQLRRSSFCPELLNETDGSAGKNHEKHNDGSCGITRKIRGQKYIRNKRYQCQHQ